MIRKYQLLVDLLFILISTSLFIFHDGHGIVFKIGNSQAFIPISGLMFGGAISSIIKQLVNKIRAHKKL